MAGLREVLGYWLKDRAEGESTDVVMEELRAELERLSKRRPTLDLTTVESILTAALHHAWNRKLNTRTFREKVATIRARATELAVLIESVYSDVDFPLLWQEGPIGVAMRTVLAEIEDDPYLSLDPIATRRGNPGADYQARAIRRMQAHGVSRASAQELLRIVRLRNYTPQTNPQHSD